MSLLKMARVFDKLSQVELPSKKASLKDRIMDKLSITAQNIGGYPAIDTFTQSALKSLVNPNMKVDGLLDKETLEAIRAYKAQRKIPLETPFAKVKEYIAEEAYTGRVPSGIVPAAKPAPTQSLPRSKTNVQDAVALNQGISDINSVNKSLSPADQSLSQPGTPTFRQ